MTEATPKKKKKIGWVKATLLVLLLVIGVFLIIVSMQPADFTITRSATIAAPTEAVFAQVNDFQKWGAWSPWEKMDPAMKKTFDGKPGEAGATYAWVGNDKVGEGKMTVLESKANQRIKIKLEFIKPFASTSETTFNFAGEGGKTNIAWTMTGKHNFMSKAMCLFMDMDKMVGGDFEKGLAALKDVAEKTPVSLPATGPVTATAPDAAK